MTQLILATHNDHKAKEFRDILPLYSVQTLADLGHDDEIKETATSLEGNSFIKAETVFKRYGHVVISDDSGLEVDALNGAPGVYSARYAGDPRNDQRNTEKLLDELQGASNRKAQFRTVITLMKQKTAFNLKELSREQSPKALEEKPVLVMILFLYLKGFSKLLRSWQPMKKIKLAIVQMRLKNYYIS